MLERFIKTGPEVSASAWVHSTASVIGRVKLEDEVSVWPGAVLRGDVDRVEVGRGSNIQDLAVLHPNSGRPVLIGQGVTVGHSAIVHGSIVGAHSLIGMGAVIMDCRIGEFCIVAAGSVVPQGADIPPRSLVMGAPGKVRRALTEEDCAGLLRSEKTYIALAGRYRQGDTA